MGYSCMMGSFAEATELRRSPGACRGFGGMAWWHVALGSGVPKWGWGDGERGAERKQQQQQQRQQQRRDTTSITATMKISIILAIITCINRSEDSNNKRDSHTEEVCVLISRLFQSEGDFRLEFVRCSVHVIEVTSGSIHNTAQETWQVPTTFFANLLRSESMMFMKQGLFPTLLSCNGAGVTISVDLSRCQVAKE